VARISSVVRSPLRTARNPTHVMQLLALQGGKGLPLVNSFLSVQRGFKKLTNSSCGADHQLQDRQPTVKPQYAPVRV
jgi:hypothetical protein